MMRWWDSINALKAGKALPQVGTHNVVRIKRPRRLSTLSACLRP
jgi:hypothetical protein